MLSLEMSVTAYKKIGMRNLKIIFIMVLGCYAIIYLLNYLANTYPSFGTSVYESVNLFAAISLMVTIMFIPLGLISLFVVVKTIIGLMRIYTAKVKSHFRIDNKSVKVLTPLSFSEKDYSFNSEDSKIVSINIDNSAELSFSVTLDIELKIFYLIFWKTEITKHSFHLYDADYSKLMNFIKKTHPNLRLTYITAKEEARGWKGTGRQ
jgi:hypothetical protein